MSALDIDRDAAHEAAQRELAKPIYPKASLTERFTDWLQDLLYRIAQEGSQLPGGWFTITVLIIILAVAIVIAVRIARRTMRTNRGGERALFDSHELTAAQHRATAEQYAAQGDWTAAIRHRSERSLVSSKKTACSIRCRAARRPSSPRTPEPRSRSWPASCRRPQSLSTTSPTAIVRARESAYRMIADLDDHLRSRGPAKAAASAAPAPPDNWTAVR